MSATLPNLSEIALWLDACLYVTNFRPVEVKEYMKMGDTLMLPDGNTVVRKVNISTILATSNLFLGQNDGTILPPNLLKPVSKDRLLIFPLIAETILQNGSMLVFCQSKNQCEQFCCDIYL